MGDMPVAEVEIDAALVRGLLADQHPDLAERALSEVAFGWDNVSYRLGDDLVVRMPRRALSAPLIEHEQRWLPHLAPRLPLPVPAPVRVGRAAPGYPWSWSVCPWLPGVPACAEPPTDPVDAAAQLGAFLEALHRPAATGAPENPYRGVPLAHRDATTRERVARSGDHIDGGAVLRVWDEVVGRAAWNRAPVWLHGDLHPANLLVHEGRLTAVIDFGDLTSGDPATDLAVAWMLFPPGARGVFRAAAGTVDDDTWARARGWALALALAYLAHSADNPTMARIGRETLTAVLAGD
jgi:aminoglycoside phosphotransferase (APT) family kinase protein